MRKNCAVYIYIYFYKNPNLGGNSGGGVYVVIGNDNVIGQNDNVILDFLRDTLGPTGRQIQPYGPAPLQ